MNNVPEFIELFDNQSLPYFSFNNASLEKPNSGLWNTTQEGDNMCTFLSQSISISRQATGVFSKDLTTRDDLILAILSLALVLVIQVSIASVLLQSDNGNISNFRFSVKQFVDLAREFRLRYLVRGPRRHTAEPSGINYKVLAFSVVILLGSFGLETAVLFFTNPTKVSISNGITSFRLLRAVRPDWDDIRDNLRTAALTPCTAITFEGVDQEHNIMSACLTSNVSSVSFEKFKKVGREVNFTIISDSHEYGSEHYVRIGNLTVSYSSRAHFTLSDSIRRLMTTRNTLHKVDTRFKDLHKQIVAFLFSAYRRDVQDERMNLERLRGIQFRFTSEDGPDVNIVQVQKRRKFQKAFSTRRTTEAYGTIPRGPAAFQLIQAALRASTAISVSGPDRYDLDVGSGNIIFRESIMWKEPSRTLNWLTMSLLLAGSLLVLVGLRLRLKPVGAARIANEYMRRNAHAHMETALEG